MEDKKAKKEQEPGSEPNRLPYFSFDKIEVTFFSSSIRKFNTCKILEIVYGWINCSFFWLTYQRIIIVITLDSDYSTKRWLIWKKKKKKVYIENLKLMRQSDFFE